MKLGQHFLKSKKIVDEIVKAAEITKSDTVLEVGPGKGILTEALLKKAGKVIAVEKDESLIKFLREKFKGHKNLKLIQGDILKIRNPKHEILNKFKIQNSKFKIVANIPYYITSRFLKNFLSTENQPTLMVLMLQKEVAERIVARDKKESLLSISVKVYGWPRIIKKVAASYFSPPPKVDSAIVKISGISKDFFRSLNVRSSTPKMEQRFFEMVRKGFAGKRKMLKNNLKISADTLEKCGIPGKARAEQLRPEDWKSIYHSIYHGIY
jgi:16S rRNA (adenine1518-N6/adenine1519-N6)-dimethyltransferase